ncbi:ARM repeat-containing protein, partial [Hortaea werneckii]
MGEEEEFANLPLPDQFQHKNWKARKGGYETATKEFRTAQPSDPIVREFILESGLWKAAVSDSNVAAQQEALGAYNAFLEASGTEGARKTRSNTVGGIVEKGLTGRPAAKTAAMESLLLLIELDKPDPIIEEILPYLSHKMPKLITAALSALTNIYHAYGCKTVEPKPVIKLLPKVFAHADKNVRAEAQNLTVELYRWLREAMKPLFWGELKEVQQKDLDKLFEPVKAEPQPKQERLLRSQQAAAEAAAATGDNGEDGEEGGEGEGEEDAGVDLEPEFEAVDVLAKVPKDFTDRLASSKWKDRKEALDELYAAVNVPAIQEGQFDDLIRGCAKSMKDANIAVVTVAANCVECIAKGLRKAFSRYKGTILSPMLERFKEKKASVTDAIAAACDAVFMSTSLSDIQPEVLEALKNKNPQIKEHSAKFLIRCLKATRDAPSLEQTKELSEAGKKLLTESVASLRDAGAEILGVLWK